MILRADARESRPPPASIEDAAAIAAWFSEFREQQLVDVQWTRRKNVRKPRRLPPGTVLVKRFETIRVRPALPIVETGPSEGKFS